MENIIEYIKTYGEYTFAQKPFNEVDSLVICQLSYLNFQPFVPTPEDGQDAVSIQNILEQNRLDELLSGYWFKDKNEELVRGVAASKRFGNMKLNYHVNVVEEATDTQFSALTCFPDEGICYVAYRGTDATFVGWKEDMNLALSEPTHSQEMAVEYLDMVYQRVRHGLYVGGHSKGGNLASYAAMNCSEETKENLIHIYNHDGPGFRPEIFEKCDYASVKDRMDKFIPKSSIVGVIMETCQDCEIIESHSIGAMQHCAFNWKIDEDHFVRVEDRTTAKKLQDEALNEWILSLSQEQVHTFVDTLYEVVTASGAEDMFEVGGDLKGSITRSYEAVKDLDEDTRNAVHTILHALYEIAGDKFREEFTLRWEELQKKMEISRKKLTEEAQNLKQEAQNLKQGAQNLKQEAQNLKLGAQNLKQAAQNTVQRITEKRP